MSQVGRRRGEAHGRGFAGRAAAGALAGVVAAVGLAGVERAARTASSPSHAVRNLAKLGLSFEPNLGQAGPDVSFTARTAGGTLLLSGSEASLRGPGGEVRLVLEGADPKAQPEGAGELPGKVNYLKGADPSAWRTNVPTFGEARFRGVYPGIDVAWHGAASGHVEYDFEVAPGADPGAIALRAAGAELRIDADGDLVAGEGAAELRQRKPVAYQEAAGRRSEVAASYALDPAGRAMFALGPHDRSRPLVIDPLVYASPLGGGSLDAVRAIAVDSTGAAYVAGFTFSDNFPTAGPPFDASTNGALDAFVAKVNPAGTALMYSTYLGGASLDDAYGIAVNGAGNAFVTGETQSTDFPATTFRGAADGGNRAFVAELAATGSSLVYSKLLCTGGPSPDPSGFTFGAGQAVALDGAGAAYVTGFCNGVPQFPRTLPVTSGAFQPTFGGFAQDAFVAKVNPAGTDLVYASWLGGEGNADIGRGIAVDAAGAAYVTGELSNIGFPTTAGSFSTTRPGGASDAFITKVNAAGSALVYSTFLGGGGTDTGNAIAVDITGAAYVTGHTDSSDFPVAGSPIRSTPSPGDQADAFVTKLNASGSALVYSTRLGGSGDDHGLGIAVDAGGGAHVVGQTRSVDFPTVDPILPFIRDFYDMFVADLNAAGSALTFSSYLEGGADTDNRISIGAIAVDAAGTDYVGGLSDTGDLLTQSPFQPLYGGGRTDGWVAKITHGSGGSTTSSSSTSSTTPPTSSTSSTSSSSTSSSTSSSSSTTSSTSSTSTSTSSTSTSSTSTSSTSTSSTSTSSTSTTTPTTSSSSTSTSTTSTTRPTTSSSSTSTSTTSTTRPTTSSSSTSSSSTTVPGPTTTTTPTADRCAQLVQTRQRFNADIDRLEAALRQSLTGAQFQSAIATLEASRALGNAQIDQALAACRA